MSHALSFLSFLRLWVLTVLVGGCATAADPFILVIKTDNPGTAASNAYTLPLTWADTYDFTVDWGDGSSEVITTTGYHTHTYVTAGTYAVAITENSIGGFPSMTSYTGDPLKLLQVAQWGDVTWSSMHDAFDGCANLTCTATDGATARTGAVTDFRFACYGCSGMTSFPLIDTSAGVDFSYAWYGCSGLTSFPLISTAAGVDFSYAWYGCSGLTSFPLIDTAAAHTFFQTWAECSGLTSFPLLDAAQVTDLTQAWQDCSSLTSFPLLDIPACTTCYYAWEGCAQLVSFPQLDTSAVTDFSYAWFNCRHLLSFPQLDTSVGTNFRAAWLGCSSLVSFPALDFSAATDVGYAWSDCTALSSFPLVDFSGCANFRRAWYHCPSLSEFPAVDLSHMTDGRSCFAGDTLSTVSYSALLRDLAAHNTHTGVQFDGGLSGYDLGATSVARNAVLVGGRNWVITDGGPMSDSPAFVMDITTSLPGISDAQSFVLPLCPTDTYDFTVDWGDGSSQVVANSTSPSHTYATAGTYEVRVSENQVSGFPHIYFNGGGDAPKVLRVSHWGAVNWSSFDGAFNGCANLHITATDANAALTGFVFSCRYAWKDCSAMEAWPALRLFNCHDFTGAWINCRALTGFPYIAAYSGTSFNSTWRGCSGLKDFAWMDTSAGVDFRNCWRGCPQLQIFPPLDLNHMVHGDGCFTGDTLSTQSYSAILRDLGAHNPNHGVVFSGGGSFYDQGATATARNTTLVGGAGWTITDGGQSPWLTTPPAPTYIGTMLLLTDGSVMAQANGGADWYRLTPDSTGDYTTGTWTALASMHDTRLYYASTVLRDGRVFVAGGEYGTGTNTAEVYDPQSDVWTVLNSWNGGDIGDSTGLTLDDGRVLLLPREDSHGYVWDPQGDAWTVTATRPNYSVNDEESAVRLPDGSVLIPTVATRPDALRYLPTSDQWVPAGTIPADLIDSKSEIGAGARLYDGRVLFLGATGATDFYTPAAGAVPESWAAGPMMPDQIKTDDAPIAVMPNGHVLLVGDLGGSYLPPSRMYEFDPSANTYASVPLPNDDLIWGAAYNGRMLMLPTGQVLMTGGGQPMVYTPAGAPSSAWRPVISGLSGATSGHVTLSGTQLNGLTDGAAYGDDAQMASCYPLVRFVDAAQQVWYARTSGFSTMAIATGSLPVSVEVAWSGIPDGTYALQVVTNGIASLDYPVALQGGVVHAASPVAWATPMAITYGTVLSASQLNATSVVAGTFAYSPAAGILPNCGRHRLSVTFTPSDTAHYSPVTTSVVLVVDPAPLTVTASAAARSYGAANPVFTGTLSGVVAHDGITATYASSATPATAPGVYGPASAEAITPTLHDPHGKLGNYTVTSAKGTLTVTTAQPLVTWATPAAITYGTVLSTSQLNASSSVAGTFVYSPAAGVLPNRGRHRLSLTFTPTDSAHYAPVTTSVVLVVNPAALSVTAAAASRSFGAANPLFSGTLTGVVAHDGITATYASSATPATAVGVYGPASAEAITPTLHDPHSKLANYTVTSTKGTLTVTSAAGDAVQVDDRDAATAAAGQAGDGSGACGLGSGLTAVMVSLALTLRVRTRQRG